MACFGYETLKLWRWGRNSPCRYVAAEGTPEASLCRSSSHSTRAHVHKDGDVAMHTWSLQVHELYTSCTRADVAPRTPAAITTFISPIETGQHTFLLMLNPACYVLGPCVVNDLCRDTQRDTMQALRAGAAQACQRVRLGVAPRSGPQRAHACPSAVGLAGRPPLPQACSYAAASRMLGSSRARCVTVRAIATLPNKRDNRIPVTVSSCGSSSHSTCSVTCMALLHTNTLPV